MQLNLALDAISPLSPVYERLSRAFGLFRQGPRLSPLDQLIRAMIGARTHDEVAWSVFLRLRSLFHPWDRLIEAPRARVEAAIAPVTHAELKAAWLQEALERIRTLKGGLDLGFLAEADEAEAMAWLKTHLPGVGDHAAATVLNFSTLRRRAMAVETHVWRVARRIGLAPRGADPEGVRKAITEARARPVDRRGLLRAALAPEAAGPDPVPGPPHPLRRLSDRRSVRGAPSHPPRRRPKRRRAAHGRRKTRMNQARLLKMDSSCRPVGRGRPRSWAERGRSRPFRWGRWRRAPINAPPPCLATRRRPWPSPWRSGIRALAARPGSKALLVQSAEAAREFGWTDGPDCRPWGSIRIDSPAPRRGAEPRRSGWWTRPCDPAPWPWCWPIWPRRRAWTCRSPAASTCRPAALGPWP